MKIENLNVTGGQVNIADRIEKITYNPNFGISLSEFHTLTSKLKSLNGQQLNELKNCLTQISNSNSVQEKESFVTKAKNFLVDIGVAFASSLTIDGLVQLGQALLI